ncbi:MAG: hypothetical protein Q9183_006766, partial [Haloplaca sp. 2 TL-2023]
MVKLVIAPPPIPKDAISQIVILPFLFHGADVQDAIKFGGEADRKKSQILQAFQRTHVNLDSEDRLVSEPLTSGLIIPRNRQETTKPTWPGGILKIVTSGHTKPDSASTAVIWAPGTALQTRISIGEEVPDPFSTNKDADIDGMLHETGSMIGVNTLLEQLFSHLSHSSSVLLTGGLGS